MKENIKYIEVPESQNGIKPTIFYDIECLPEGISIETISELAEKDKNIPYVECKGIIPTFHFYQISE